MMATQEMVPVGFKAMKELESVGNVTFKDSKRYDPYKEPLYRPWHLPAHATFIQH